MAIKNTNFTEELLSKFTCREDRVGQAVQPVSVSVAGRDEILIRLQKHLLGELRLGLYNLLPNGSAGWAVVEFENHGETADKDTCLADALKYHQYLSGKGIPSILERSKRANGQCYHLHLRFDKALPARTVREGLRGIGKELFGSFQNEVFPKSDDGLGNFIWMPLFGGTDEWGLGVSEGRTVFLDGTGQPCPDQNAILVDWQSADSQHFTDLVKPYLVTLPSVSALSKTRTGIELNQPGLEKMEARCPIVARWIGNPVGLRYDHWLGLGSNFIVFRGGWERFVELSKQDAANFDQYEIDRIHDEVLAFHGPQTYEKFHDQGLEFELPVNAPKAPAGWGSKYDPIVSSIVEQNGCYGKLGKEGVFEMLTPFTIEPNELLDLSDGDVLTCKIKHTSGREWDNITIENTEWHSPGKFMAALGHTECTYHGEKGRGVVDICQYVVSQVPVRKQGTRIVGLLEDQWVIKDSNITASGYLTPMTIIPYDRSQDSLHTKIAYQHLDDQVYSGLVRELFENLLNTNLPEAILPIVGWFFVAPLKPRIMELVGSFPILFCYGTQGGGKTSLLEQMLSLHGYKDPTVYSCTMKAFPMLVLLCSTNAVPVVLDEYKPWDMRDNQVLDLGRLMRKIYKGEVEDKGHQDQSVSHYKLQAPVVVCGESKVKEAAVLERVLIAGFTDEIKRRPDMQRAFGVLRELELQGFMDRYVMFCLGQDVKLRFDQALAKTKVALNGITVAPRLLNNLTTMTFGLELLEDFARQWGIEITDSINLEAALAAQVEEITGDGRGQVKLAVDQMLEQLALLAEKDLAKRDVDYTFAKLRGMDTTKTYLAIHLKTAVQTFKANAFRIGYDGELLDDAAYLKQLKNCDYTIELNHATRFKTPYGMKSELVKKCVIVDLQLAKAKGLELAGFEAVDQSAFEETEVKKGRCAVLEEFVTNSDHL